jgi:hypothetical protein
MLTENKREATNLSSRGEKNGRSNIPRTLIIFRLALSRQWLCEGNVGQTTQGIQVTEASGFSPTAQ